MQQVDGVRTAFRDLSSLVLSTEVRLRKIAERGFVGRMLANNTRDLAEAMLDVVKMQSWTVQLVRIALTANANNLAMTMVIHSELQTLSSALGVAVLSQSGQADQLSQVQGTVEQMLFLTEQQWLANEERERQEARILALQSSLARERAELERQGREVTRVREALEVAAPHLMGIRAMTLAKVIGVATLIAIGISFLMTIAVLRGIGR
ncbi:MAG: hypothetical protein Q8Q09_18160 [Deltaproteobacteria bacterium]|nr:hypothetical protein [Deltaproteobacteria bacterium]